MHTFYAESAEDIFLAEEKSLFATDLLVQFGENVAELIIYCSILKEPQLYPKGFSLQ